jgi:hypothetical protein
MHICGDKRRELKQDDQEVIDSTLTKSEYMLWNPGNLQAHTEKIMIP